jgi:hypothetical protein
MSNSNIVTTIRGLSAIRCPFAIPWSIWAVVIDSVKAEAFRAFAHISEKCLKRIHPGFAHINTAPAVMLVSANIRVAASALGVLPRSILMSMSHSKSAFLGIDATATPNKVFSYVAGSHNLLISAVT